MAEVEKKQIEIGDVFTKLTVVSNFAGERWICRCECGTEKTIYKSSLISKHRQSCGQCIQEKHGLRQHKAYKSWLHMKQRCNNPDNLDYPRYGGRGLIVHPDFMKSFSKWLAEIGERPDGRYSIGRIDNNLGYTYGNMRWETDAQQARNHGLSTLNKTGIVGVIRRTRVIRGSEYPLWVAQWADSLNHKKSKDFSCNKYGEDNAKQMAIDYRNKMIEELNTRGFEYAESHGSVRKELND